MADAALYLRVSTDEQAQEGFSIEAQRRVLEAYSVVKGYDRAEAYIDEGYSAKNLKRPQMQRLIERCKAGEYSAVLVWRLDRLSRSLRDTLMLCEDIFKPNGIELISTSENIDTSTPSGRLMLNILASFAQNEREVTSERVSMVSKELAQKCVHMGGVPPFGYRVVDKKYVIEPSEAEAVRQLFDMYVSGQGYTAMLRYLDDNDFKTPRGNGFAKNSLYDMLSNEKYVGTYIYNRRLYSSTNGKRNNRKNKADSEIIRIEGGIPAIIDHETWEKAALIRERNKKAPAAYAARRVYMLSGIAVCGVCGSRISGATMGRDRNGQIQAYYACPHKCVRNRRKEKIEAGVVKFLQLLVSDPAIVEQSLRAINDLIEDDSTALNSAARDMAGRIAEIKRQIENILAFIASAGEDAPASLLSKLSSLEQKKEWIEGTFKTAQNRANKADASKVVQRLQLLQKMENSPEEKRKTAIQEAVERVTMYPDHCVIQVYNGLPGGGGPDKYKQLYTLPL